jgi:hypothetical protein
MPDQIERRKNARINARWPVKISADQWMVEGETRNIAAEGVFIYCSEHLVQGKTYRISINAPDNRVIEVSGKVVWTNPQQPGSKGRFVGMGFCFMKISAADRNIIDDLIMRHPEFHHAS